MAINIKNTNQALQLLDSPRIDLRKHAIVYLQRENIKEAIPLMLDLLLNDPEPGLRVGLVRTLASMEARESIPYLIDLLHIEPENGVRIATLGALGDLEASEAIPLIIKILQSPDESDHLKQIALEALLKIGRTDANTELANCLKMKDFPPKLKPLVIRVLAELDALESLIPVFPMVDESVQRQLLELFDKIDLLPCISRLLEKGKSEHIQAIIEIFYQLQPFNILPNILRHYPSWPIPLKRNFLEVAEELKPEFSKSLNRYFSELEPREQKVAISWIFDLALSECVPILLKELYRLPEDVQTLARETLGNLGVQQYILQLLQTDQLPDPALLQALPVLDFQEAFPYLLKYYGLLEDDRTRQLIVKIFEQLKAVSYLLQITRSINHPERQAALHILGNLKDRSITPHLVNLSQSEDIEIANTALNILEKMKARDQIPALIEHYHLVSQGVEDHFISTLKKLQAAPILLIMLKETNEEQPLLNLLKLIQHLGIREAAQDIVQRLSNASLQVKILSLITLVRLNVHIPLEDILFLVQSRHKVLLQTLHLFFEHFQAEKTLKPWLSVPPVERQIQSILAFKLLKTRSTIPDLLRLLTSQEKPVRQAAAAALTELQAQPEILRAVRYSDATLAFDGLQGIFHLKMTDAIPELLADYPNFQGKNKHLFRQIIEKFHIKNTLPQYLQEDSFATQISVLSIIEDFNATDYIFEVLNLILASSGSLRERAIQTFKRLEGVSIIENGLASHRFSVEQQAKIIQLADILTNDELIPAMIKMLMIAPDALQSDILNILKKQDALPEVLKAMGSVSILERLRGIQALGHLGAAQTIPMVLDILHSSRPPVQIQALETLRKLNARSTVPQLLLLSLNSEGEVLNACLETLKIFQAEQHTIPQMLLSHEVDKRMLGLQVLILLDPTQAEAPLKEALRDPKPEMRVLALELLTKYDLQENLSFVIRAISDIQPSVREKALTILTHLSPSKGLQYVLDELLISPKTLLPTYQKSLLEIMCAIPFITLKQRLFPLLDTPHYRHRLLQLLERYLSDITRENEKIQLFCLEFAEKNTHQDLQSPILSTIQDYRQTFKNLLQSQAETVFKEYRKYTTLLQLLIRFSKLSPKDIRFFIRILQQPFQTKRFLQLTDILYKRLQELLERYGSKLLSETDSLILQDIFTHAVELAEDKGPKAVEYYRHHLLLLKSPRSNGGQKIIALHNRVGNSNS